jgi:hypothetical protein
MGRPGGGLVPSERAGVGSRPDRVTDPHMRDRNDIDAAGELDDEPDFATREEQAAAAEAAAIGGRTPDVGGVLADERVSEALRPVYEAGGGEQDGFELAERDLVRNATHDDGTAFPERDGFAPEHESDEASIEYGEADGAERQDL